MSLLATAVDAAIVALVAVGSFFLLVGTVGIVRFPDVYNRLHASSKATTLGAASIFLAGYLHFGPLGEGLPSLVGIVFLFLTVPTGAHMISRSANRMGVEFYGDTGWPESAEPPGGGSDDGRDGHSDGSDDADTGDDDADGDRADSGDDREALGDEEPDPQR